MTELYGAEDAAPILGISANRVRALARSRGLGVYINNRTVVFRQSDIDAMRVRRNGRPRKVPVSGFES